MLVVSYVCVVVIVIVVVVVCCFFLLFIMLFLFLIISFSVCGVLFDALWLILADCCLRVVVSCVLFEV